MLRALTVLRARAAVLALTVAMVAGALTLFRAEALSTTIDLNSTSTDLTVYGDDAYNYSGYSVAVGDIDGDGTDDLIIAADEADPAGGTTASETYVIYGGAQDPTPTPTVTLTPTPVCIDRDGDTSCRDPDRDPDDDGCTIAQEAVLGSVFDPSAWYDVYDVPAPVAPDPDLNGLRNRKVDMQDILAVLFYYGTKVGGDPTVNGVDYDSTKGIDTANHPNLLVGHMYDRSAGLDPDPVAGNDPTGPPNGKVDIVDMLAVLAQYGIDCRGVLCIDRDGDTSCRDADNDPDDDGCTDAQEAALGDVFDPNAWYDVYDVPAPVAPDPDLNGLRNRKVDMQDILAVVFYYGAKDNGLMNRNGVDYDSTKGIDTANHPNLLVGHMYDRSAGLDPDPVTGNDPAGPPNGKVDLIDMLAVVAQYGTDCREGPPVPTPTPTDTPEPTATAAPEPTATGTPEPTATAAPEPTATDTAVPTPTDTPEPGANNAMAVDAVAGGSVDGSRTVTDTDPGYPQFDVSFHITQANVAYGGYSAVLEYDSSVINWVSATYSPSDPFYIDAPADDYEGDGTLRRTEMGAALFGTTDFTGEVVVVRYECIANGESALVAVPPVLVDPGPPPIWAPNTTTLTALAGIIDTGLTDASVTCTGFED